jgi:hypothetical protein
MRWGQGFFRLWLVLSLLWIGSCVFVYSPVTYSWLLKGREYNVSFNKSGHSVTLDTSRSRDERALVLRDALKLEADPPDADKILAKIDTMWATDGDKAREAWLITFIPPLALLGLGFAMAWIIRGFRRQQNA